MHNDIGNELFISTQVITFSTNARFSAFSGVVSLSIPYNRLERIDKH